MSKNAVQRKKIKDKRSKLVGSIFYPLSCQQMVEVQTLLLFEAEDFNTLSVIMNSKNSLLLF